MHEFGIAQSALNLVLAHAGRARAERVHRVQLRIGTLAGVDVEALRFAFSAIFPGTLAEGAAVDIESVAAVAHCARCAADFEAGDDFICTCPTCGDFSGDIRKGRELELARIVMTCDGQP